MMAEQPTAPACAPAPNPVPGVSASGASRAPQTAQVPQAAQVPRVLSIAGTDPSGGAGIQADLKSIAASGGYGMCVTTSLVAQNTCGVREVFTPPLEFLTAQLAAVFDDVTVDAVKIGMLGDADTIRTVRTWLSEHPVPVVVLDPVMIASSGDRLLQAEAEQALRDLVPLVNVITPNIPELAVLCEKEPAQTFDEAHEQAANLAAATGTTVIVKGGHLCGQDAGNTAVFPDGTCAHVHTPRLDSRNTHGTGCSLSSSLATRLGVELLQHTEAAEHTAEQSVLTSEDTRRALNLAQRLGVKIGGRLLAFHEHNERERSGQLLQAARGGSSVLMISDAGMPSVSDPGFRLVNAAIDADVPVTVAPGPSAVLTALALSGLASDRFSFEGFLPRKSGERARLLSSLASDAHTLIFFESPRRVHETLTDLAKAFGGQRRAALCRELTKTHEEVLRASLDELVAATVEGARGEIVLVVAGSTGASVGVEQVVDQVLALADQGLRLKQAAAQVAQTHGLRKNELYQAALAAREN